METYNEDHSTSPVPQLTETITFDLSKGIIQNSEFQEFVKQLERSQHVMITMDEIHEMISISGKKAAVSNSHVQIQNKIIKISLEPTKESKKPPRCDRRNSDTIVSIKHQIQLN
jgi:hypothetical protein